jgi:hypothetical protein
VGHPQAARLDQLLMRANTFQQQHAPVARSDSTPIVALDQLGPADCLNRGAAEGSGIGCARVAWHHTGARLHSAPTLTE